MIKSVTLKKDKESFTGKLYNHTKKDVTFNFTDGINIITGRNGSGKSVLLKIIKTNCLITKEASYPRMVEPSEIKDGFFSDNWLTIPKVIQKRLINNDFPLSSIEWDGSMVHYLTPDFFNPSTMWRRIDSPLPQGKELFSDKEIFAGIAYKNQNSSGEQCIRLLNKMYELHTEYDEPLKMVNDLWKGADDIFQNWIHSFPMDGKPTLIIDELDHHLDLDNQKTYWDYIGCLVKKWQVIVVSHSIFSFKQVDVNHIPLQKEYFEKVKSLSI